MSKKRVDRAVAGAAVLFASLGDPTRLVLLQRLARGGPASISVLAENFETTRQAITKHLQVLSDAGVIDGERRGREHVWAINPQRLADAERHLQLISRGWDEALGRLKDHLER